MSRPITYILSSAFICGVGEERGCSKLFPSDYARDSDKQRDVMLYLSFLSSIIMVNHQARSAVQRNLDSVTGDPSSGIAGIVFVAVGEDGEEIVAVPSGKMGLSHDTAMDLDSVFWLASCTKLLTSIACMQAHEQGRVNLDDAQFVYQHCPELKSIQVLRKDGKLSPKKADITLRMLLTHTSGFAYELCVLSFVVQLCCIANHC